MPTLPLFSTRLNWETPPNPLLQRLAARRAAGVPILDLTESNPTQAGFHYPADEIRPALAQPAALVYHPSPRGLSRARQAVARYYGDRGRAVDPDSIYLTASTSEAYAYLFKLLADPGDEILVPQPGYPLFDFLTALDSARPVYYSLRYDEAQGWHINFERLMAALGPRTRAVVVVSPHNPAGAYLKSAELAALNAVCAEHGLALIVDEVFWDYPRRRPTPVGTPTSPDVGDVGLTAVGNSDSLTFVLSGLSKVAGLPQMKLGWIQISGPAPLCAAAQSRLDFIADTYLSASAPVQQAAPVLLAGRGAIQAQITDRLEANHDWLAGQCARASHCRLLQREGGWYAVLEFQDTVSDDERAQQLLELDDVFVHPGYFYDFARDGYLVLSLLTPSEIFQAGSARLLARWGK